MTTEHNDTPDDEPVETDGGVADTEADAADGADAATEDASTSRSLGEVPLSRRNALKISGAIGGTALSAGGAAASEIDVNDPAEGNGFVAPGQDTTVLDLDLTSNDEILDVSGGSGAADGYPLALNDGPAADKNLIVEGGEGLGAGHPQPDLDQTVVPGDHLSSFSFTDRVLSSSIAGFDNTSDHLVEAAGRTFLDDPVDGLEQSPYDVQAAASGPARFVNEYIDSGFTTSFGSGGAGSVYRNDGFVAADVISVNTTTDPDEYEVRYHVELGDSASEFRDVDGDTSPREIEVDLGTDANDGVTLEPGTDITVNADGLSPNAYSFSYPQSEVEVSSGAVSFAIDIENTNGDTQYVQLRAIEALSIDITLPNDPRTANDHFPFGTVAFRNEADTELLTAGNFSTSLASAINPQLAAKVDSIGVGQTDITGIGMPSDLDLPYTAGDVQKQYGTAETSQERFPAPDVVVVNEDGSTNSGTGYTVEYDAAADEVSILFHDHRTDVTLPNSGFVTGISNVISPRGRRISNSRGNTAGPSHTDLPASATAGAGDTSTIGLAEGPDSGLSSNDYVRIEDGDDGTLFLIADAELDTSNRSVATEFNGHTGYLQGTAVDSVAGETLAGPDPTDPTTMGIEISELSKSDTTPLVENIDTDGQRVAGLNSAPTVDSNGYVQVELPSGDSPETTIARGDAIEVNGVELLSGAPLDSGASIATQSPDADGVLSYSEAIRELELTDRNDIINANSVSGDFTSTLSLDTPADVAIADSGAEADDLSDTKLETPTQLFATAQFDAGASALATETVDVTLDERVTFSTNGDSDVTDDGVLLPSSSDSAVTVEMLIDGRPTGVTSDSITIGTPQDYASAFTGLSSSSLSIVTPYGDYDITGNGDADIPVGEEFNIAVTADVSVNGSQTVDLTRARAPDIQNTNGVAPENDQIDARFDPTSVEVPVTVFEITNNIDDDKLTLDPGYTDSDEELGLPDDEINFADHSSNEFGLTGRVRVNPEAFSSESSGDFDLSDAIAVRGFPEIFAAVADQPTNREPTASSSAEVGSIDIGVESRFFLRAAGVPEDGLGTNSDYQIVSRALSETSNAYRADRAFLNRPEAIANALEWSLNEVSLGNAPSGDGRNDAPSVTVTLPSTLVDEDYTAPTVFQPLTHDPHSAPGYLIRSDTPVDSEFDQNVDVSSVEVAILDATVGSSGDSVLTTGDVTERIDVANALGFGFDDAGSGDTFNTVSAETPRRFPHRSRSDPLGRTAVTYNAIDSIGDAGSGDLELAPGQTTFLGSVELTCNDVALGDTLTLLGAEGTGPDSSVTFTELQDSTTNDTGIDAATDGQEVYSPRFHNDTFDVVRYHQSEEIPLFLNDDTSSQDDDLEDYTYSSLHDVTSDSAVADALEAAETVAGLPPTVPTGSNANARVNMYNDALDAQLSAAFVEGFAIIETRDAIIEASAADTEIDVDDVPIAAGFVGDGIFDGAVRFDESDIPSTQVRDIPADNVDRALDPTQTSVAALYGDRFDGLSVRNRGSVDLTDISEHTLQIPDTDAYSWIQAGSPIDIAGQDRAPLFPQSRPDLVVFIGSTPINNLQDEAGGTGSAPEDEYYAFTDDQGKDLFFGGVSTTSCGTEVDDTVKMTVEAAVSQDVAEGETLQYELPTLYDEDIDGNYDAVRPGRVSVGGSGDTPVSATFQDRGIFFESHDDRGDLATDVGEVIVDLDASPDFVPEDEYESTGGNVTTQGLLNAIEDWRSDQSPDPLTTEELLAVINSWRNR